MENQISTQSGTFNLPAADAIGVAKQGKKIVNFSEEEVKEVLRYAMALIGVPESKVPKKEAKHQMIVYVKRTLWLHSGDELKLAFDYAVEKRTEVKLTLFDEPFSVKLIMEVWDAYEKYKKGLVAKQPKTDENTMNVYQRGSSIIGQLKPEVVESINSLAEKDKVKPEPAKKEKSKYYDMHQRWMRNFDNLKRKYEVPNTNGRMIYRYGRAMNIDDYFNKKFEQLQLAEKRNKDVL